MIRIALLGVLLLLAACSSAPVVDHPALRQQIIESALGQLGRPYRYGGRDPSGFDCSGLVQYAYSEAGLLAPRDTRSQREAGKRVAFDDAQPADLLFYRFEHGGGLHVGLYIGDGRMIHAPASGKKVSLVEVAAPVWKRRYLETIRLLR
ncbi:MAG: C40 family peptidase [Gammaproteobacteria bacterium]|nr:C40 family peptidase [Gammaproteobacteria bacterium]